MRLLFSYFLQPFYQSDLLLFELFLYLFAGSLRFFRLLGLIDKNSVVELKRSAIFLKLVVPKTHPIDKEGKKSWSL